MCYWYKSWNDYYLIKDHIGYKNITGASHYSMMNDNIKLEKTNYTLSIDWCDKAVSLNSNNLEFL